LHHFSHDFMHSCPYSAQETLIAIKHGEIRHVRSDAAPQGGLDVLPDFQRWRQTGRPEGYLKR